MTNSKLPILFPRDIFLDYEGLGVEQRAKEFLEFLGWSPEKTEPKLLGEGVPDFKCLGNRWVEVKTRMPKRVLMSLGQLEHWSSLIQQKHRVFVLELTTTTIYNFYEVTALSLKNILVNFE